MAERPATTRTVGIPYADGKLAAQVRSQAWRVLDAADRHDSARLRRAGQRLQDAALLLEVGSDRESPAQLRAAVRRLQARAISELRKVTQR